MTIENAPEFKTACGGTITDPEKYPSASYRGERLFFCAQGCLRAFEQNPEAFLAGEIEHPLDDE